MNTGDNNVENKRIRTKLSKVRFPEYCPVCMEAAEDLVFITIVESKGPESYETSSWMKQEDKMTSALQSARTSTTFPVPTCMLHGSKSVRTTRTRLIPVLGFFVFFYPIVFFLLQINLAVQYSNDLTEPVLGALFFVILLIGTIVYGVFPRALERSLKFDKTSRIKDRVDILISNQDYRKIFLEMNEM